MKLARVAAWVGLLALLALPAMAAVTSGAGKGYVSIHPTNGGDTVLRGTEAMGFTLGGDLIGDFVGGAQVSAGFWPFHSFFRDTTPPTVFSLLAPATASETNATSIRFSWGTSFDSNTPVSYRLQIANDSGFASTVFDSAGIATTALSVSLPGNAWYSWRVTASDTWGNATTTSSWVIGIDAGLPSTPTLLSPARGESTTSGNIFFTWSASADSALANPLLATSAASIRYRIQVARDSTFGALVASDTTTDTSRYLLFASLDSGADTLYWRVSAVDGFGNASGWGGPESFVRRAPADTTPPLPPLRLTGRATDTGAALLSWEASPSRDMLGGGYRLYWDAGAETAPAQFLAYIAHGAATLYSHITDTLTGNRRFRFRLQAVDAAGNQETGSNIVEVVVPASAANTAWTEIITPHAGHRVNQSTGGTEVVARIIGSDAQRAQVTAARFQYRYAGGSWTDMTPVAAQTNPVTWRGTGNIGMHWNVAALPLGDVDLRVVPILSGGVTFETTAGSITVKFVANGQDADVAVELATATDSTRKTQVVNRNSRDTLTAMTPSGSMVLVFLDSGVAPAALDTQPVKLIVGAAASPGVETTTLERQMTGVGVFTELRFSDSSQPGGVVLVGVPLPGLDANGNVRVRGKDVPATQLEVWSWSADTGRWEKLGAPTLDLVNKVAWFRVTHFSFFTLAAPVAAVTNLTAFTIYPNPFMPNDADPTNGVEYNGTAGTGVTFENLPQGARVRIFTTLGELIDDHVVDASGGLQWDVRNLRGERVASGIYVYIVTAPNGERRTGKLGIVR